LPELFEAIQVENEQRERDGIAKGGHDFLLDVRDEPVSGVDAGQWVGDGCAARLLEETRVLNGECHIIGYRCGKPQVLLPERITIRSRQGEYADGLCLRPQRHADP
jgi:hypothetical protein